MFFIFQSYSDIGKGCIFFLITLVWKHVQWWWKSLTLEKLVVMKNDRWNLSLKIGHKIYLWTVNRYIEPFYSPHWLCQQTKNIKYIHVWLYPNFPQIKSLQLQLLPFLALRILMRSNGCLFHEHCIYPNNWLLCWSFTAQSTQWVMSSAVSLPNHTFTGQA